jgi:polycystin 2
VIGTSSCQILLNVYMFMSVKSKISELLQLPFEFADFSQLANFSKAITYLAGFNVFIAWLKIFKYTNFNKTMQILSGTLSNCAKGCYRSGSESRTLGCIR